MELKSTVSKTSHVVYAKKEVILSAGTLDSPKILMVSGIGPSEELKKYKIQLIKDFPVGKNFHDHLTTDKLIFFMTNKASTMKNYNTGLHGFVME